MSETKKLIALTFDDGPALATDKIVEALAVNQAKATFFVIGQCLALYPRFTRRAVEIGCEIGNHTIKHNDLTKMSFNEIVEELAATSQLIKQFGTHTMIMRPPFGAYNETVKKAAKHCGLALINWSLDTGDWASNDAALTRSRILNEIKDGDIVLCHDRMPSTGELMTSFVEELISLDYQPVTVTQLFKAKGIQLQTGCLYRSAYDEVEA